MVQAAAAVQTTRQTTTTVLRMGLQVTIRIVGRKTSEPWLEEACDMYARRLQPSTLDVATVWHKNDAALLKGVATDYDKRDTVVLLDPGSASTPAMMLTSERLADKVYQWLEEGGSRLVFVIGGAEGLPAELKYNKYNRNNKPILLSLSPLTFTHQFARLVLMEQIYRASEIRKGSGYHK